MQRPYQWGGFSPKARGRMLDGRQWRELPTVRRVDTLTARQDNLKALPAGFD